ISLRNFAPHFLVLGEIAQEARARGWPLSVPGPAASLFVCYLLGVIDLDPLRVGLEMGPLPPTHFPENCLEVPSQAITPLWNWIRRRYGPDHVARAGSVQRLGPAAALQLAAQVHELPAGLAPYLSKSLGDVREALNQQRMPDILFQYSPSINSNQWHDL